MPGMARVECSFAELDALGAALDVNVWRYPFATPQFGGVGRADLFGAANATLSSRGLVHGDRIDPDLERILRLYATGAVSIAVNGMTDRTQLTALAVLGNRHGVLATLREERIALHLLPIDSIVRAVVTTLPPHPPGPGSSVTVTSRPAPTQPPASAAILQQARPRSTNAGSDHQAAQRILARPRHGGGSFLIGTPTRAGRPGPSDTLSWIDTDAGRYAVTTTIGSDGRLHVTYLPADNARIHQLLHRSLTKFT